MNELTSSHIREKLLELDLPTIKIYQILLRETSSCNILNKDEVSIIITKILLAIENNSELLIDFLEVLYYLFKKASNADIEFYCNFFNRITENDSYSHEFLLQFIHQFLISISVFNLNIKLNAINIYSENKLIKVQSLICTELLITKFNNHKILDDIWNQRSHTENHLFVEIFTHFVEYFLDIKKIYLKDIFWKFILLNLDNERKFSIYWLQKTLDKISNENEIFECKNFIKCNSKNKDKIIESMQTLIIILNTLQNKQSHLILPSLNLLPNMKLDSIWLEFCICELMKHTNPLVLKWSVSFIIKNYTSNDFQTYNQFLVENTAVSQDCLSLILNGFNYSFLYSSNELSSNNLAEFIKGNVNRFISGFANINWKSLPFHYIMTTLQSLNIDNASVEILLKISAKIRVMECKPIRLSVRLLFWKLFKEILKNNKNINDFLNIVDTIYNPNETLEIGESELLLEIIGEKYFKDGNKIPLKFMEILNNNNVWNETFSSKLLNTIEEKNLKFLIQLLTSSIRLEKHNIIDIYNKIENCLKTCNLNEKRFLKILIDLIYSNYHSGMTNRSLADEYELNIKYAADLIENDFKNIGGTCTHFKELFVDLFSMEYCNIIKLKFEPIEIINRDYSTFNKSLFEYKIETLMDKGGIKALVAITKFLVYTSHQNLDINITVKTELIERIIKDISYYLKKIDFESISDIVKNFVCYLVNNFLNYETNYILNLLNVNLTNNKVHFQVYLSIRTFCKPVAAEVLSNNKSVIEFFKSNDFIDILMAGILFGEPLLGDQRLEFDYIVANNLSLGITDIEIRKVCIHLINDLYSNKRNKDIQFPLNYDERVNSLKLLKNRLLDESIKLNHRKARYFKNSKQHRLKLRLVQCLGLISDREYEVNYWDDRYLVSILEESNQPDVTYIMELVIAYSITTEKLIKLLNKLSKFTNSAIISLFAISYLHCIHLRDEEHNKDRTIQKKTINSDSLAKLMIHKFLPWTMGQNFNIRLQAQITVYHLIEKFNIIVYSYLLDTIKESLSQMNAEKNFEKLTEDFRYVDYSYNQSILDWSRCEEKYVKRISVIYTLIPIITNLSLDEWYIKIPDIYENLDNENIQFALESGLMERFGHLKDDTEIRNENLESLVHIESVQRKINPESPNRNEIDLFYYSGDNEKNDEKDMTVVASLIDKLPNLGGIARTCEVLGIKNLMVSSLKYVEAKDFKGLSMTAEKWLNLSELRPFDIKNYIIQKKSEGYEIVGAEQTSNSINFADFKFPKKTILLLGHEKEGIPANLLTFLDYAVEIQQFGLVRSLNVHVTGALFMWEYSKQHLRK